MSDLPQWLTTALAEMAPVAPPPNVDQNEVQPGQIRLASVDGTNRHVLVARLDDQHPVSLAVLMTGTTEMATEDDVLISPDESGLSYALLCQTSLTGMVLNEDLGEVIGSISPSRAMLLSDAAVMEEFPFDYSERGLPVHERSDPRVDFKEEEGSVFDQLQRRALEYLAEEEKPIMDPRDLIVSSGADDALFALEELVARGLENVRFISDEALSLLIGHEELSVEALGPELFAALLPYLQRVPTKPARALPDVDLPPEADVVPGSLAEKVISCEVAARASSGARVIAFTSARASRQLRQAMALVVGEDTIHVDLPTEKIA